MTLAAGAILASAPRAQTFNPPTITLPDSIMAPGTQMKWVKKVPQYCEGPAVDPGSGIAYFTEQLSNSTPNWPIWRIDPAAPSDTGLRWITNSKQSNGLFVDGQGRVIAAQKGKVVRYKKDGTVDAELATSGKTATFNQANDLSMGSDGSIYFTDLGSNVFYADAQGNTKIVASGLYNANGIEWLEDEKVVNVQTGTVNRRYDVGADGALTNPRDFFSINVGDGCEVDSHGNFYLASYGDGVVYVVNAKGTEIGKIVFNSQPSPYDSRRGAGGNVDNCHFGGKDWKTLYCTGDGGLYSIDLKIPGRAWPLTGTTALRPGPRLDLRPQALRSFRADGRWWRDGIPGRAEGPHLPVLPGR
jgi:sugar lactone lactonase YvrE